MWGFGDYILKSPNFQILKSPNPHISKFSNYICGMDSDEKYMRRCLELAALAAGSASPNPMVGAVIVGEGRIVGEGHTAPYGGPHAEVNAVNDAIRRLGERRARDIFKKSTIYVSLEPCAHFGKTPPCADMLAVNGFAKVVIGCLDPFGKVDGRGLRKLRGAGMDAVVGVLEDACRFANRRFFTRIKEQRPYVILKWAQTADGFFAPPDGRQQWISNEASKQLVHRWRAEEDAVLVGTRTAKLDNPSLTTRLWKGRNPKRILIDRDLEIRAEANILNEDAETIIFNAVKTDWQGRRKYIQVENFPLYLPQNILYQLHLLDVLSLIVEGGSKTLRAFIDAGLWDEARVFTSPDRWGAGLPAPRMAREPAETQKVGNDRLDVYLADAQSRPRRIPDPSLTN